MALDNHPAPGPGAPPAGEPPVPGPGQESALRLVGRVLGPVGLLIVLTVVFTYFFISGEAYAVLFGKLGLGLAMLAFYLATNWDVFARLAGSRSTAMFWMGIGMIAAVAVGLGVLNWVAVQRPWERDLTREGVYTLHEQTIGTLRGLSQDVEALAFYQPAERDYAILKETLERYTRQGPRFAFRFVDPDAEPGLVEQYQVTDDGPRLVIRSGSQDTRAKELSEEELTNAILRVTTRTAKAICLLQGHGEGDPESEEARGLSAFVAGLRAGGYRVQPLRLISEQTLTELLAGRTITGRALARAKAAGQPLEPELPAELAVAVPDDCGLVAIVGPKSRLLAAERAALDTYLQRGGKALVLLDWEHDGGLAPLLERYRVRWTRNLIVDGAVQGSELLAIGLDYDPEHPLTRHLAKAGQLAVMVAGLALQSAAALQVLDDGGRWPAGAALDEPGAAPVEAVALARTGPHAWGETALGADAVLARTPGKDLLGPLTLAVAVTQAVPEERGERLSGQTRLVVLGDWEVVGNQYLQALGNKSFMLNAVDWLQEEEQRIAIRPRARQANRLFLSPQQAALITFFSIDLLPVAILAIGLSIIQLRRRR